MANPIRHSLAFGGDSHMRNIMRAVDDLLREGNYQNLQIHPNGRKASGGATFESYFNYQHQDLLNCSAAVVLVSVGGNDADCVRSPATIDILRDNARRTIEQLEASGKTVYFCEFPRRFSVRTRGLRIEEWKNLSNTFHRFLRRQFSRQFIHFPAGGHYRQRGNFRADGVHLLDERYRSYAEHILRHVNKYI